MLFTNCIRLFGLNLDILAFLLFNLLRVFLHQNFSSHLIVALDLRRLFFSFGNGRFFIFLFCFRLGDYILIGSLHFLRRANDLLLHHGSTTSGILLLNESLSWKGWGGPYAAVWFQFEENSKGMFPSSPSQTETSSINVVPHIMQNNECLSR